MTLGRLDELRAEVGTLERMVSELTDEDVIERMQLEQRLAAARKNLEASRLVEDSFPRRLPITFRGRPVEGSSSIDATFAALAVRAFVDAADTAAASIGASELKDAGPLPGRGERSLRIVDSAIGSFGFLLELPANPATRRVQLVLDTDSEPAPFDPYADGIRTMLTLLDEASRDDEETISDLVAEVHPRAARKVRAFAKVLSDHQAFFAASFDGTTVRLDQPSQVQRVLESLEEEDISEAEEVRRGTIVGVLPISRAFEAMVDGATIKGKVDRAVDHITEFKARWENREALLELRTIKVRAQVRYVLTGANEVPV